MKEKNIHKLNRKFMILMGIIIMAGCSLGTLTLGNIGKLLNVDENGKFTTNIIYSENGGRYVTYYGQDGTYEYSYYMYEDSTEDLDGDGVMGEGWVQRAGRKGSYNYSQDTMVCDRNYTHSFMQGVGGKWDWAQITNDSDTVNYIVSSYFTESKNGECYVKVPDIENKWRMYRKTIEKDGSYVEFIGIRILDTELMHSTYYYKTITVDENGDQVSGSEASNAYSITSTYPENEKWKKGVSITFELQRTVYKHRSWDNNNQVWENWTFSSDSDWSDSEAKVSRTFTHCGDFIADIDPESQREY